MSIREYSENLESTDTPKQEESTSEAEHYFEGEKVKASIFSLLVCGCLEK